MNLIRYLRHPTLVDWALLAAIFVVSPLFDLSVNFWTAITT